ncbi:hypothetical protein QP175_01240 [Sphingomonas aerolata]|uniref:hypothetical protein n=1 Tax=Sphingomonas aerolata TaxID=185951 RepID=UPI002FDF8209
MQFHDRRLAPTPAISHCAVNHCNKVKMALLASDMPGAAAKVQACEAAWTIDQGRSAAAHGLPCPLIRTRLALLRMRIVCEQLFELEKQAIAARESGNTQAIHASQIASTNLWLSFGFGVARSGLGNRVEQARLTTSVVSRVAGRGMSSMEFSKSLSAEDYDFSRSFVERLTGQNLSRVSFAQAPRVDSAEAMAMACGRKDHVIVLPAGGYKAPDLLIHELGHTAEFTVRRATGDPKMLRTHRILSETVAYYCQFSYLRQHGTADQRQFALAAFLPGYLAAQFIHVSGKKPNAQAKAMIGHPRFGALIEEYGPECLLQHIESNRLTSLTTDEITHAYVEPLFSIPVALNLLQRGDPVQRVMMASADVSVISALQAVGINGLASTDFRRISGLFNDFIDDTL